MSERFSVREIGESIDLDTDIDYAIAILQELKGNGWEGLEIQYEYGTRNLCPYRHRPENDAEYQQRIDVERTARAYRKRTYEALKKEFEDK